MEYETLTSIEETVAAIEVQTGDVIVINYPGRIGVSGVDRLRAQFDKILPGVKFLVLDEGMKVDCLLRSK